MCQCNAFVVVVAVVCHAKRLCRTELAYWQTYAVQAAVVVCLVVFVFVVALVAVVFLSLFAVRLLLRHVCYHKLAYCVVVGGLYVGSWSVC